MVRRKRLMWVYGSVGLVATLLAAALVWWSQRPTTAYRPGKDVEGITRELARDLPEDYPRIEFHNVAAESGIRFRHFHGSRSTQLPEDMGSGAAWGDYDGDGDADVFLCNLAGALTLESVQRESSPARNRLYRNDGGGRFTDVTESSGVGARMMSMAAAWGDVEGDGDLDLIVTGYGELRLYRNDGNGVFSDITEAAGLGGIAGFWAGASWADYDRDGDLDLYVCGYVRYEYHPEDVGRGTRQYQAVVPFTLNPSSYPPERNLLFRNDGRGVFSEVAAELGVANLQGRSLAASWCDVDEDGWPDLYVANDVSDNALFRNDGDGTFTDVSHEAWVADYRGAMGLAVGDWDGDRDQDLFVTHWIAQENALYSNLKYAFGSEQSAAGELRFMDVADMHGLGQIALDYVGWGTFFFDYDNDGRPDLFVANGSTFQKEDTPRELIPMASLLFWNAGVDRGFFEVSSVSGADLIAPRVGRGAATADFDDDGDLDILLVAHGERAVLLRNEGGNTKHWLRIIPRAEAGNRFAVGAKVHVEVAGLSQYTQIGCQASYLSQNPYEAHFGLGGATQADRVVVVFPSGKRVERESVAADQRLVIWEPES